ncbi:MAG: TolC family protein [Myxococcota bacterium]
MRRSFASKRHACLAAVLATGCAGSSATSGPLAEPHEEHAPDRVGPGAAAAGLDLPDPAHGRPVSLAQMLAWADAHAPAVRVAESRMARAEAASEEARLLVPEEPTVSVAAGPRIVSGALDYDLQAWLGQRFEVAGERRLRIDAARALGHRFEAARAATRWEVHQRVHHAFHEALAARERLQALERVVAFEERMLEIAQSRLRAGDVSPLQVRLAEGERARAQQRFLAARQRYEAAQLTLAEAAGWPVTHPPEPAGKLDPPRDAPPLREMLELAEQHHPVLHELEVAVEEAQARVRLADREAWPKPGVAVGYQREGHPGGPGQHSVLGRLRTDLPVARRNRGPRAEARAAVGEAEAERDAYAQRLQARVARGMRAVQAAADRVEVYGTELLPALEEGLRMLERAHELGEIDVMQVAGATDRLLRAQEDALQAYEDYHEAAASLEAAVGTDLWEAERHDEPEGGPR